MTVKRMDLLFRFASLVTFGAHVYAEPSNFAAYRQKGRIRRFRSGEAVTLSDALPNPFLLHSEEFHNLMEAKVSDPSVDFPTPWIFLHEVEEGGVRYQECYPPTSLMPAAKYRMFVRENDYSRIRFVRDEALVYFQREKLPYIPPRPTSRSVVVMEDIFKDIEPSDLLVGCFSAVLLSVSISILNM